MKIVLITPACCDDQTFQAICDGLARSYHEQGHEVIAVGLLDGLDPKPQREPTPWGEMRRLGGKREWAPAKAGLAFLQLLRLVRGADVVHLHFTDVWTLFLPAIWLACRVRGVPVGFTFHDFYGDAAWPKKWWESPLLERMVSGGLWVTADSRFCAREIARSLPRLAGRIQVVPNGVAAVFPAQPEAPSARPFVLCAARLVHRKGIDVLLMAWKDVCGEFDGVDLAVCGADFSGGHYQRLARLLGLSARVRFLGKLERSRVWALMHSCLFFVYPSRRENFGMAALEAMACGKAVLATRTGGVSELIEDGQSGLLVASEDVEALGAGLRRLLGDAELRAKLGKRAKEASACYHWEGVAGRYLGLAAKGDGYAVVA